jgi:hypothetical protein
MAKALTFKVSEEKAVRYSLSKSRETIDGHIRNKYCTEMNDRHKSITTGRVVKVVDESTNQTFIESQLGNGLVGTAFEAYNKHHALILRPDDIWIAVGTVFAGYVDRNAERLRSTFVNHEGQIELVAKGGGNIHSADYDYLVSQIVKQIEENTNNDVRKWMECEFSTTTTLTRTVSQLALMSAMKNYFSYKMCLECNLPQITLEGTRDDWVNIHSRVAFLRTFRDDQVLSDWADVLEHVLQHFIDAYDGKIDAPGFWNRIAHQTGGGSGPRYVQGWILTFFPFDDKGKYCLNSIDKIKAGERFGKINTNDVSSSVVSVPVTIDDNGTKYKTKFFTGLLSGRTDKEHTTIRPNAGWSLVILS